MTPRGSTSRHRSARRALGDPVEQSEHAAYEEAGQAAHAEAGQAAHAEAGQAAHAEAGQAAHAEAGMEKSVPSGTSAFSHLPSVEAILSSGNVAERASYSRDAVVSAVRDGVASLRDRIAGGEIPAASELEPGTILSRACERLRSASRPKLQRIVNATGTVLHTNFGRAVLSESAIHAVTQAAAGSVNLEYDIDRGERGDRDRLVEEHLCALTGAEAATVVNNNAAAVLLTLRALAEGKEVVVSRGELVEIGGSFRIPEIMQASGARLREVGATNRTHLHDYQRAIGSETALLMKVHASNYRIVGFTSSVAVAELAGLVDAHPGLFVVEDLGSGAIVDLSLHGLRGEPVIHDSIAAGADLVLASGDKLLGGPQCGIVVGRAELVERLRRHPLKRALRCDKMTLAALEATLRVYRFAAQPEREIPTLRFLLRPVDELRGVAEAALPLLAARLGGSFSFDIVAAAAEAGSGSQPEQPVKSVAIAVRSSEAKAMQIERLFRGANPPVIGRVHDDVFLLDVRLVDDPAELVPGSSPD